MNQNPVSAIQSPLNLANAISNLPKLIASGSEFFMLLCEEVLPVLNLLAMEDTPFLCYDVRRGKIGISPSSFVIGMFWNTAKGRAYNGVLVVAPLGE